jgi:hypothetical protein
MANLKERLLSLVNNGANAATDLFATMNETMNAIDWDAQFKQLKDVRDAIAKKGNELFNEFDELMKQVKNSINDFEVSVPFDEASGEHFEYKIEDGKLLIEVTFEDENTTRSNKSKIAVPENCDVEKAFAKYNAASKTMTVVIPKMITEASAQKVADLNETHVSPKTEETAEAHTAESKILKKFRQNSIPRAANGRFARRTPKTEGES